MNSGADMPESTEFAVLSQKIETLSGSMERLIMSNERLITQFERVTVLEEKHTHQEASVGRAFKELERIKARVEACETEARDNLAAHEKESRTLVATLTEGNEREHKFFSRSLWLATGFCMATAGFWSVFGYHVERVVDEQTRLINEARVHMYGDKIKTSDDVRAILREPGSQANK